MSLSTLVLNLGESLLDHLFKLGDEEEFLASHGGGIFVFGIEGAAESGSLIPKSLVAGKLVLGGLGNGGLGADALVEVLNLVLKLLLLGGKTGELAIEALFLVVESLNGISVGGGEVVESGLDVLLQGLEELSNTFKGGLIDLSFLDSKLGKGGKDGGILGGGLDVDGVLEHLLGDLGDLDEGAGSGEDSAEDILGLLNGANGVGVVLGSSGEVGLFDITGAHDDAEVLLVGEGLLFVDLKGVLGADQDVSAAVELGAGVTEDVAGVLDLGAAELVLRLALGMLGVVDLVVVDLLGVDGIAELGKDVEDGIKG